jgi:hypothetical protein
MEENSFQIELFGLMKRHLNVMVVSVDTIVRTGPQKILM